MRVTSEIFVAALLRRLNGSGGFGAVIRRGNNEAGAIYLLCRNRNAEVKLLGPAPQAGYAEAAPERGFAILRESIDEAELEKWVERETRFDSDLWIVELEPGEVPLSDLVLVM